MPPVAFLGGVGGFTPAVTLLFLGGVGGLGPLDALPELVASFTAAFPAELLKAAFTFPSLDLRGAARVEPPEAEGRRAGIKPAPSEED